MPLKWLQIFHWRNRYSQVPLILVALCWSTPAEKPWPSLPGVTTRYKLVTHNIWVTICASMFHSLQSNHVRRGPWTLPQFISTAKNERVVCCKGCPSPPLSSKHLCPSRTKSCYLIAMMKSNGWCQWFSQLLRLGQIWSSSQVFVLIYLMCQYYDRKWSLCPFIT